MTKYISHTTAGTGTVTALPASNTTSGKLWDGESYYTPKKKAALRETHHMTQHMWHLEPRLQELMVMLTYARPDGSKSEKDFIKTYIDTLPDVRYDSAGNRVVRIGEGNTVCWASHTDTVDWDEGRKALRIDSKGRFALDHESEASCLGADCTAGVWLMRRMILAGKPGLYIFHRGEECGGKGSKYLAKHGNVLWKDIKFLISLDRKGKDSVITSQFMGETASNAFARSIAPMLPRGFKADPYGSFTDSANYADVIQECSNLSIGYEDCHTTRETLDFTFTDLLLKHLIALDYSRLVAIRKPGDMGPKSYYGGSMGVWDNEWDEDDGWNGRVHEKPVVDKWVGARKAHVGDIVRGKTRSQHHKNYGRGGW